MIAHPLPVSLPPTQNNLEDAKETERAEEAQEEGAVVFEDAELCLPGQRKENVRPHQKQMALPLQQRSLKDPPLLDHHLQQSLQLLQLLFG